MYADITASRVNQHRAAMEKHAVAARQAKRARSAAPQARKAPAQRMPRFGGWSVTGLARRIHPVGQPARRPVTV